ncbi:hypothetical protein [Rhodococcus ruber]|uniref:hypothetical protein n=1 Tax=Rhodococcus ruber TaxID=1830 RepID=UPI0003482537|nr:hypothetical protein [Rhodococcus ruber]
MPAGVEVIVEDGFATVTPEPAERGRVLTALLAAVDEPSQIRTDTSGRRRAYVVLEQDARKAGLLDQRKPAVKKTAAKKAAPRKATERPDDVGEADTDTEAGTALTDTPNPPSTPAQQ